MYEICWGCCFQKAAKPPSLLLAVRHGSFSKEGKSLSPAGKGNLAADHVATREYMGITSNLRAGCYNKDITTRATRPTNDWTHQHHSWIFWTTSSGLLTLMICQIMMLGFPCAATVSNDEVYNWSVRKQMEDIANRRRLKPALRVLDIQTYVLMMFQISGDVLLTMNYCKWFCSIQSQGIPKK